jgi:two-component system response regulator HydG
MEKIGILNPCVMIAGADESFCLEIKGLLENWGYIAAACVSDAAQISSKVQEMGPDLLILDQESLNKSTNTRLDDQTADWPGVPFLVVADDVSNEAISRLLAAAPRGCLIRPLEPKQLKLSVELALAGGPCSQARYPGKPRVTKVPYSGKQGIPGLKSAELSRIIGSSAALLNVLESVRLVAATDVSVIITGENGTGKELVAEAIHKLSARALRNFIGINCSAIPNALLESALFGHSKGAFTGANREQEGFLERAEGGTLFLDEIGDVTPEIQVKLLRLLQSHEYYRVGDTTTRRSNVRLITATNRDLESLVAQGKIREDFYYRINVFPIFIPPLRERGDDVVEIADYLIGVCNRLFSKAVIGFSDEASNALKSYHWPGNVRQLENVIKRAFVLVQGPIIQLQHLPPELIIDQGAAVRFKTERQSVLPDAGRDERSRILAALAQTGGHRGRAAEILGYSRITLWKKLSKLGLVQSRAGDSEHAELQPTEVVQS